MTNRTQPRKPVQHVQCRCAIYTRKSTEEGLEQAFNSLDAQREACEAYIKSQKHEGWIALPAHYDDGGFSGGNLNRPALQRIMEDIESGLIDTVVVYKVDRLTRSLHDFAKIVDVFDRKGVSFVSVTQQFNTTTSMGRLTLNMLLSFAQFEREVTGERIRDKIAASKRKGMWMGGVPPLGYDVDNRKLVINPKEAKLVQTIFNQYLELGSVHAVKTALDTDGALSKVRVNKHGRQTGGKPFARGALYKMLQNRIYRGEIVHKDHCYPGEHPAIVPKDLWDLVQQRLISNRVDRANSAHIAEPSLLTGLVYDDAGQRMIPTHANKKGTRYRYYISQKLTTQSRKDVPRGRRVPAHDLERLVQDRLTQFLTSESELFDALEPTIEDVEVRMRTITAAADLVQRWDPLAPADRRARLLRFIDRIDVKSEVLELSIYPSRLPALLENREPSPLDELFSNQPTPDHQTESVLTLTIPARLKRTGMEMRLLIDGAGGGSRTKSDQSLCRLLAQAYRYQTILINSRSRSMDEIAAEAGVTRSYFRRVLRMSFLAPEIVQAILRDRHPVELNAEQLSKHTVLPLAWDEQRKLLGID